MLNSLRISNYALIENVEISFEKGFSSITGETGAGKSIILGALSVLLGKRSDTSVLKNKDVKSVIEAEFILNKELFNSLFEEFDLDFDTHTIIRREILPQGKTRGFINDTPVTVNILKAFGEVLIDIHSQHQNLFLKDSDFQLHVVDAFAQNKELIEKYKNLYNKWFEAKSNYQNFISDINKSKSDLSYYTFRLDELVQANLQKGEQEDLESSLQMLEHGEDIKRMFTEAEALFDSEEVSFLAQLKSIQQSFEKRATISKDFEELAKRLLESHIELSDISYEISRHNSNLDFNPSDLDRIQSRLDTIYSLLQKFSCEGVNELLQEQERLQTIVSNVEDSSFAQEQLEQKLQKALEALKTQAEKISLKRKQAIKKLEPQLIKMLQPLGMPNVSILIKLQQLEQPQESGLDEVQMLFSANKNIPLQWLGEISSGGEISRVMLCLKAILAQGNSLQTIIFDEIDTGVSGEIADQMGNVMREISNDMQVIAITHLPQIAAKSKKHFKVFKTETSETTITNINELNHEQRIEEIAKMMSGKNITNEAIANAKVLLDKA